MFYDGITDFIFIENQPEKADVIFLPGGHYPEGARRAASLYQEGWAPFIIPSGRYPKPVGYFSGEEKSEWEYLRKILLENGVPDSAILKEDQATYTWENAIFSRRETDRLGMKIEKALLCCQAFHARRALTYYLQQFPETNILVIPVETRGINRNNWFLDPEKTDVVLGELEKCGTQFHCMLPVR